VYGHDQYVPFILWRSLPDFWRATILKPFLLGEEFKLFILTEISWTLNVTYLF